MAKKDFSKQTVAASFFSDPVSSRIPPTPEETEESIVKLPLDRLHPYPDQPFRAYTEDKLQELSDDIRENGILSPIIVRPLAGDYQILSGHNRAAAAQLAGLEEAPCIVKVVNDDEAMLILVNTNLNQRQELLPSEKAIAYQMRMEALKRQGKRTDLTLSPEETKLDTATQIAENESRANVFRYLRLNQLQPELVHLVDSGRLPFKAGVQLSYLPAGRQGELVQLMNNRKYNFDEKRAEALRTLEKDHDEPMELLLKEVFQPPKKRVMSKLTRRISIVVPTDEKMLEQLRDVRKQFGKGTSMHMVLSEIIDKIGEPVEE